MRDPHVNSIRYNLETIENVEFINCPTQRYDNEIFTLELNDGVVNCFFKKHIPTVSEARSVVEKLIKSWEIDYALKYGRREFKLKYIDAEVIDRNPQPSGSVEILASAAIVVVSGCSATLSVTKSEYPSFSVSFKVNPDVETLWNRYEIYLEGREQLLGMGYFCLSYLENLAGGKRYLITNKYQIERAVLDLLGDLTSCRGDSLSARKGKGHTFIPLTNKEKLWIEECIRKIIYRIGECEANPTTLQLLTMADLPSL